MCLLRIKRLLVSSIAVATVGALTFNAGFVAAAPQGTTVSKIMVCMDGQPCFSALSIGFQVTNEPVLPGGIGGKAVFDDISIFKPIDSVSARLFLLTAMGSSVSDATITMALTQKEQATIYLEDVTITKFKTAASQDEKITGENVNLHYGRITITSGGYTVCWDLGSNSSCSP